MSEKEGEPELDRNAAEGVIPGQTADLLFLPDEFLTTDVADPKEILISSLRAAIPGGHSIKSSVEELERASSREREHDAEAVHRVEGLVGQLCGAVDVLNRSLFMRGRQSWEEGQFSLQDRVFRPEAVEGWASRDNTQVAVLVQIHERKNGSLCLPPWQALYPGPVTELGQSYNKPIQDPGRRLVKVATGVTLDMAQVISPESFPEGVGLIIFPATESDELADRAPRRGEHDFDAEPIFTPASWDRALQQLVGDVSFLEPELSRHKGQYGFGLSDIAARNTSFMLGYAFIQARAQTRAKEWGDAIILPVDPGSYELAGDVLHIKHAVAISVTGEESPIGISVKLNHYTGTPVVSVSKQK